MPLAGTLPKIGQRFRGTLIACSGIVPSHGSEAAFTAILDIKPDVVLMGIHAPALPCVDWTRKLVAAAPGLRVIMITACADRRVFFECLMAGAAGYLLKPASSAEIAHAISSAASGGAPMSALVSRNLLDFFQRFRNQSASEPALTVREQQIMACVISGEADKEIATRLGIDAGTVHSHLHRVFEKLGAHSRQEAIEKYLSIRQW